MGKKKSEWLNIYALNNKLSSDLIHSHGKTDMSETMSLILNLMGAKYCSVIWQRIDFAAIIGLRSLCSMPGIPVFHASAHPFFSFPAPFPVHVLRCLVNPSWKNTGMQGTCHLSILLPLTFALLRLTLLGRIIDSQRCPNPWHLRWTCYRT